MTLPGTIVLAKRREDAMRAAGLEGAEVLVGSRGQAAKGKSASCAWGFTPSPLAMKVVENVLELCSRGSEPGCHGRRRLMIYACYAGTHSSALAASLHLGIVDSGCDISELPYFDRRLSHEIGVPAFVGRDNEGTDVYALGTGWLSAPLERAVSDLVEIHFPGVCVCICSVRGFLDFPARVGGFASRRLGLVHLGRALIAESLARKLPEMRRMVRRCLDLSAKWKDNEGQSMGEVIWFDGSKARGSGPPGS